MLAAFGAASPAPKRVLVLHSFGREVGPFDAFAAGFRRELERQSSDPLEFYDVSLQPLGPDDASAETLMRFLLSMYGGRPPDLIVPVGGPASMFAHKYRARLFPATPMLMTAVDQRHLQKVDLTSTEAAVAVRHDAVEAIENIRRLLPQTSNVFVVLGDSPLERFWREDLDREFQRFRNQLTFVWGTIYLSPKC
jgi:hypothetical protein